MSDHRAPHTPAILSAALYIVYFREYARHQTLCTPQIMQDPSPRKRKRRDCCDRAYHAVIGQDAFKGEQC